MNFLKTFLPYIIALAATSTFASNEKDVKKFLSGLDGVYELTNSDVTGCPQKAELKTHDRLVYVINRDLVPPPEYPDMYKKTFDRIGLSKKRIGDDMFTYNDYISRLLKDPQGSFVTDESRNCGGVFFVNCGKWVINYTLAKLNEDSITVWVNPRPNIYDGSGFPAGNCSYTAKK